jgi:hypothetical protein
MGVHAARGIPDNAVLGFHGSKRKLGLAGKPPLCAGQQEDSADGSGEDFG